MVNAPDVSRRICRDSTFITKRCVIGGAVARRPSTVTAPSCSARSLASTAIIRPSGDHAKSFTWVATRVSCVAAPERGATVQIWLWPPLSERNAMRRPSGDQRGGPSLSAVASRIARPLSVPTNQRLSTCRSRALSTSSST
jgi:hypothetical protein